MPSLQYPRRHHDAEGPGPHLMPASCVTTFSPLTEVASLCCLRVVARLELRGSSGRVQPPLHSTYTMQCHPPHHFPLHRLLQSSSCMSVNYTLYLSSDSMGNVPHSTSRYRRLLLCALPHSIRIPTPLTRLLLSDFGPQDRWFIPPPSRANSHPQHRQVSQPDRTPASVSPFGVIPNWSIYAETDWAPVVLLGSRLGIRSDKPISRRTHSFPLSAEIIFPLAHVDERRSDFHRRTD